MVKLAISVRQTSLQAIRSYVQARKDMSLEIDRLPGHGATFQCSGLVSSVYSVLTSLL